VRGSGQRFVDAIVKKCVLVIKNRSRDDGEIDCQDRTVASVVNITVNRGVSSDQKLSIPSEAKITVVGVPDKPGEAATIFRAIADAQINIDMVVQNVSAAATGLTDISFTLPKTEGHKAMEALTRAQTVIAFDSLRYDDQIGKISLVGAGMKTNPGVTATFFEALSNAGVNIELISTSEIRISVVTRVDDVKPAVQAVHSAFGLDSDSDDAVVYGGTGR